MRASRYRWRPRTISSPPFSPSWRPASRRRPARSSRSTSWTTAPCSTKTTADFVGHTKGYDLVTMDIVWSGAFAENGYTVDLTDWIKRDAAEIGTDDIYPVLMQSLGGFGGKQVAFPFAGYANVLAYRKDLYAAAKLEPPQNHGGARRRRHQAERSRRSRSTASWPTARPGRPARRTGCSTMPRWAAPSWTRPASPPSIRPRTSRA